MLGKRACRFILFVHAFTGCDTKSRIFGIGKSVALKKILSDPVFRNYADVFLHILTKQVVEEAGEAVFIHLLNGLRKVQDWILFVIANFCIKFRARRVQFLSNHFPQHLIQQSSTVTGYTYRFKHGLGGVYPHLNGVGLNHVTSMF